MFIPDHFPALAIFAACLPDADLASLLAGIGSPPRPRMSPDGDPETWAWVAVLAAALGPDEAAWVERARARGDAPVSGVALTHARECRGSLEWAWSVSSGVARHRAADGPAFDLAAHLAALADCGVDVERHYGAAQAIRALGLLRATAHENKSTAPLDAGASPA